jgi:hypothetical protein
VLPLSVAYLESDVAKAARSAIFSTSSWQMRFFDRTPDALFGDDVKQRIALGIKLPGAAGQIRTTSLRRWSSDKRTSALESKPNEGVTSRACGDRIVKIGSRAEREALDQLESSGTLADVAEQVRLVSADQMGPNAKALGVAPTAYNWIGTYRDTATAAIARSDTSGKLTELVFPSSTLADAAYAILTSRVFLWWWRATGDQFHVSLKDIRRAPFSLAVTDASKLGEVAEAGLACWSVALESPVVAVNRGVRTVAYVPPSDSPALDLADRCVAALFQLDSEFVRLAQEDAVRLRVAGRDR